MGMGLGEWKATVEPGRQARLDAMADELSRQAAHLAAAEYRWLRLLGEYDADAGWVLTGARSRRPGRVLLPPP